MSTLGYHFPVEQKYTDADFDKIINHLKIIQPEWSNVTAGSKPDRAKVLTERIINETSSRVIYRQRNSEDDGIWSRMTAEAWYKTWAKPLLDWSKNTCKGRVTLMTDNESIQTDMRPYGKWMAGAMRLAGIDGLSLAVGAFSVGTPGDGTNGSPNHYEQLDDMWEGLHYWNGSGGVPMIWRPHEYFLKTPQESGGRINRYKLGWYRCKVLGISTPPTVIGEFGMAITSALGWRSQQGYTGSQYALDGQRYFLDWYQPNDVNVLWYSWEHWPIPQPNKPITGFGVGDDEGFLREAELFAVRQRSVNPAPVTTPPVIVIPTPPKPPTQEIPSTPPPVIGKPAEVSADYARSMGTCYRSLSDSYKLMATDAAKTSEQWFKLAETLEGKAA